MSRRLTEAPPADKCQYPFGDGPLFRWCGKKAAIGRPYCPEHVGVCYVLERPKRRKRRSRGGKGGTLSAQTWWK